MDRMTAIEYNPRRESNPSSNRSQTSPKPTAPQQQPKTAKTQISNPPIQPLMSVLISKPTTTPTKMTRRKKRDMARMKEFLAKKNASQ